MACSPNMTPNTLHEGKGAELLLGAAALLIVTHAEQKPQLRTQEHLETP